MAKQSRGIVEEVLTPLLRQLATAERLLLRKPCTVPTVLGKINRDIQNLKSLFRDSDEKEKEVIHNFEAVSQLVDDLLQSANSAPPPPPPAVADAGPSGNAAEIQNQENPSPATQVSVNKVEEIILSRQRDGDNNLRPVAEEASEANQRANPPPSTGEISSDSNPPVTGEASEEENHVAENGEPAVDRDKQFQEKLNEIDKEIVRIMNSLTDVVPLWRAKNDSSSQQLQLQAEADQAALDKEQEIQCGKVFRESEAMSHLGSRIDNLDNQLKGCLFCFTMFEENEVIDKRLLIHWWIGEGLVGSVENGEIRVKELVSKRLIDATYSKWALELEVVGCKMYSWIYRLLVLAPTRKAYFSPSRRLCLLETNKLLSSTESNQEQLLTVYNISNRYLRFEKEWFKGKKSLGVIQLGRWQSLPKYHIEVERTDFLQELEQCTSAKYLSFRGISRIDKLPDFIDKLTNLIILDLRACHNLEKLTSAVTSLKKLTHLDVSECYLLEDMPAGLGNLSELQVMKGFLIGNSRRKSSCRLTELAKLTKLQKLSINIGRDSVLSSEEMDTLKDFKVLKSLTIRWGVVVSRMAKNSKKQLRRQETMHKICSSPPPKLEKLDLRCFPNEIFFEWMNPKKLQNLKKMYIRGGNLVSLRNEPGWKVEVLRLKSLKHLKFEWEGLKSAFVSLACLEVCKCAPQIKHLKFEWEGLKSAFVSLACLEVCKCAPQITSFEGVWTKENDTLVRKE